MCQANTGPLIVQSTLLRLLLDLLTEIPDSNLVSVLPIEPSFTNFVPTGIARLTVLISAFQKVCHCLFGTLNDKALQVGASLSLLYELPPIEHFWQELLSFILICMHDNLFNLKVRHTPHEVFTLWANICNYDELCQLISKGTGSY